MGSMARLAGLIALPVALFVLGSAAAADVADLYQARAIVTGQGEANRALGFALCLKDVLVKVSGDPRLLGDPAVAAMAAQAGTFVGEFRYHDRMSGIPVHDEQGSRDRPYDLTVSFRPADIDTALRSLGREPWTASRPRLVVFVGVRNGTTTTMLAGDGARGIDQREALAAAADQRGMPMALPNQAALANAGLSFEKLPAADLASLDATARTMGGDLALVGRLVWSEEAQSWTAEWRLGSQCKTYEWQVHGVTFDDAFRSAMGGAAQILSGHGAPS